jgi:phage shock protein PspC (stress-responsive transcriptional regulator)
MILSVKRLTILPLCEIAFVCEGLSFDYNWDSEVISCVQVVEIGVREMSFADLLRHLTFTIHTGTSDSNSTVLILSRL